MVAVSHNWEMNSRAGLTRSLATIVCSCVKHNCICFSKHLTPTRKSLRKGRREIALSSFSCFMERETGQSQLRGCLLGGKTHSQMAFSSSTLAGRAESLFSVKDTRNCEHFCTSCTVHSLRPRGEERWHSIRTAKVCLCKLAKKTKRAQNLFSLPAACERESANERKECNMWTRVSMQLDRQ